MAQQETILTNIFQVASMNAALCLKSDGHDIKTSKLHVSQDVNSQPPGKHCVETVQVLLFNWTFLLKASLKLSCITEYQSIT